MRHFTVVFLSILLAFSSNAKSIHWISIFDTQDSNLGNIIQNSKDLLRAHIMEPLAVVSDSLGYANYLYDITGDSFNVANVVNTISNIDSTKDDLMFVYYNGHGFAMPKESYTDFPVFIMQNYHDRVPFDYLREQLENKEHKALIMMAMTSNSIHNSSIPSKMELDSVINSNDSIGVLSNSLKKQLYPNEFKVFLTDTEFNYYKSLLTGISGEVLFCSTRKGRDSLLGNTPLGQMDFYSYALIRNLEDDASEGTTPNIKNTLDDISIAIREISNGSQYPFYVISNK